jgi:phthalate 4,5-cis-dihydrodiol dehydrogenase
MFGIGIIGAGFFGEAHARAIAELGNAKLVAASRTDAVALAQFTRQFGGHGYTQYQDLLNDPAVNVVVITTPHHLHTEIAEHAAQVGKHILVEKPMAPNLEECDRIVRAAQEANIALMVGFVNHYALAYKVAKQMIESGEIGEIVLGVSTMAKTWNEPNRRAWHRDRATGGGMWLTVGIHCLDRLTWLVGSPVTQVYAQFATRFHDQLADDTGMISLQYANGALGTVISVGYQTGAADFSTRLIGTRETMNIDYVTGVSLGRDDQWKTIPNSGSATWMHEAIVGEWRAFLDAIERNITPPISGEYGREIMRVAFAAEESSSQNKAINLTKDIL